MIPRFKRFQRIQDTHSGHTIAGNARDFGLLTKTGKVLAASFTGSPRVAVVAFATPFPRNITYTIALLPEVSSSSTGYVLRFFNVTTTGFSISLGTGAITNLIAVHWTATELGEST